MDGWISTINLKNNGTNVGIGVTTMTQRLVVDGNIRMENDDNWIGLGSSKVRTAYDETLGGGRIKLKEGDVAIDEDKWIGIDGSNPRIKFDGSASKVEISDADVKISNNKFLGLGSTIERIEFQGDDDEINIMGANVGVGTMAPNAKLEVDGEARLSDATDMGTNDASLATKKYVDDNNSDDQNISGSSLSNSNVLTIGIEDGNSETVDLSSLVDDADADPTNEYNTSMSIDGSNVLNLVDGGGTKSADLSSYLDNTDAQDLHLSGNTLSLTNDATTVDLSAYLDNTDDQNISGSSLSSSNVLTIGIEDGNSETVDLSSLVDDADADPTNEYNTSMSIDGSNVLNLVDGGGTKSADLSSYLDNTDAQDLDLSG